ncbi:MAG TPA: hypothetical protein VNG51_11680 [Ktedonobacteraceae bacterium]|nr:hypothetical protein [Ktedonobacteraceae bacterium]
MRIKDELWSDLKASLASYLDSTTGKKAGNEPARRFGAVDICEVEFGLYLLSEVTPQAPARALWVLLVGYPFAIAELQGLSNEQQRLIGVVRHILLPFKSRRKWEQALRSYKEVSDRIRLYEIDENLEKYAVQAVSICSDRIDVYKKISRQPLPYASRKISWAEAGSYICSDGRKTESVTIPMDIPLPLPPRDYTLPNRITHPPLHIKWKTLLATARWMDIQTRKRKLPVRNWYQTLQRVRLQISPDENSVFLPADEVTFENSMHVVGMVSAGKSTLMDVLAVWAALTGHHITLVVGDVMAVFERVQQFSQLGLKVAPIIGASNRGKHRKRLHRALAAERSVHPFLHQHIGFDYTSTACLLDGLRAGPKPFQMDPQPCLSLQTVSFDDEEQEQLNKTFTGGKACPFFSVCPYHQAQRDLVDASIWIATPASMVYTLVAPQIHRERLRFIEMAYLRSDLIVVDEVDRVQVQLDEIFSPSLTLMSRGKDSWLGGLSEKVSQELNREGMGQFRYEKIRGWVKDLMDAQSAAHSLYALLLNESTLSGWIEEERDYFSGLILLEKLTIEVCDIPKEDNTSPFDNPRYKQLWESFATFLDDPLGERNDHSLADLARQVIAVQDNQVRKRLQQWLQQQPGVALNEKELKPYGLRLEFAIMLEVLSDSLNSLIREWKQVEVVLGLEGSGSTLFHSPPEDYAALLPDAPMGNILGFQYLQSADDPKGPGELRFFRCMGVGRWLLLHLHDFLAADGLAGPHTLLMSGTSWAGTSPNYHLQIPVTGVLLAPDDEIEEINKSTFEYKFQRTQQRQPITISGKRGYARFQALREMLDALSREQNVGDIRLPSLLENKRKELPVGRERILLVVGSYVEAKEAYQYLSLQRNGWDTQMAYLVSDDTEFESEWRGKNNALQRGLVARFSDSEAWLLIAPLMAIERGHNILNEEKKAAIGAVYFLVRPHPRPDDINYIIHSINSWAVEQYSKEDWLISLCKQDPAPLELVGQKFRGAAFGEWQRLLRTPLRYSTLRDNDRRSLTWSQLVSIWQVIGRLVRGGCAAQVFFCDAKFAPRKANLEDDEKENMSLIKGMREVLRPYFESNSDKTARQKDLVRILYGPMYKALENMEGKE